MQRNLSTALVLPALLARCMRFHTLATDACVHARTAWKASVERSMLDRKKAKKVVQHE
jgi:hypothetical protein